MAVFRERWQRAIFGTEIVLTICSAVVFAAKGTLAMFVIFTTSHAGNAISVQNARSAS